MCQKPFEAWRAHQLNCSQECIKLNRKLRAKNYSSTHNEVHKIYMNQPERKAIRAEYDKSVRRKLMIEANRQNRIKSGQQKNTYLKKYYKISLEIYNKMLMEQNNVCAICFNPETSVNNAKNKIIDLAVDHCHKTGKVRGLLCAKCNSSLGKMQDSVVILQSAINYLIKNGQG